MDEVKKAIEEASTTNKTQNQFKGNSRKGNEWQKKKKLQNKFLKL